MTGENHAIPSQTTEEAISQLLHGNKELQPPANAKNEARLKDFDAECKRAADDPEKFWAEIAKELHWHEPWTKVFDWKYPTFEWFIGGTLHLTSNSCDPPREEGGRH